MLRKIEDKRGDKRLKITQRRRWLACMTNQWTWLWANSGRPWRTEEPGVLQRVRQDSETEPQQQPLIGQWRKVSVWKNVAYLKSLFSLKHWWSVQLSDHQSWEGGERLHFQDGLKIRRKWQPTPVYLPWEPQGRGSLVGCRLSGFTELDTTEAT